MSFTYFVQPESFKQLASTFNGGKSLIGWQKTFSALWCHLLMLILMGVGQLMTWHSSQLPAIATECQLFKTGSDFSGKPSDLAHVGLRPPLLHKPEILWVDLQNGDCKVNTGVSNWAGQCRKIVVRSNSHSSPDEGSCWIGLLHVCDSSPLQRLWHANYCEATWFFVPATLAYCCSSN